MTARSSVPSRLPAINNEPFEQLNHNNEPYAGVLAGALWMLFGQGTNTVAGNTANQGCGSVALPAIANGAGNTVTITDSLIGANSFIFGAIMRRNTSTDSGTAPAAGAQGALSWAARTPTAGSVVIELWNAGTAATLSTDYVFNYWVINY